MFTSTELIASCLGAWMIGIVTVTACARWYVRRVLKAMHARALYAALQTAAQAEVPGALLVRVMAVKAKEPRSGLQ